MKARVKQNCRYQTVKTAGLEWVKSEWRPVPDGAAEAVLLDDRLEIDKMAEMVIKPKAAGKVKHL